MEQWKKEWLEKQTTMQLLMLLQYTRKFGGWVSPWGNRDGFTAEEIKEILATREHIPNKKEAKKTRQEKAKIKKYR